MNSVDRPLVSSSGIALGGERRIAALCRFRLSLWCLGVALFGVGDVVSTAIGLRTAHVTEASPVVAPLVLDYGLTAMGALKLVTFGACLLLWRVAPRPERIGVPLGLAALGGLLTGWNLVVLATAAGAS